eukprot:scaffold24215_cov129-Isochrysis_galbana.AAC.7
MPSALARRPAPLPVETCSGPPGPDRSAPASKRAAPCRPRGRRRPGRARRLACPPGTGRAAPDRSGRGRTPAFRRSSASRPERSSAARARAAPARA